MGLKESVKKILLEKPDPRKVSHGALISLIQTRLTPVRKFSSCSEKLLSITGFNHARKFFRNTGRSVFTSIFSPVELVYAFDLIPFPLEAVSAAAASFGIAPDLLEQSEEEWISTDFCSFHRSFMSVAKHGLLPKPCFLFATSHCCDGTLKSFSEVSRFFSRPLLFINTPYRKGDGQVEYIAEQLRQVAEMISLITGKPMKTERIEKSFFYSNRASAAFREIGEMRKAENPLIYGSEGFGFILAWASFMGSREGAVLFENYRDELRRRKEDSFSEIQGKKRVLWLHLKPYFANNLIDWFERELGAVIVFEEVNKVSWDDLDPGRPWETLARKLLSNPWIGPIHNRLSNLRRMMEQYRVDGVIHFAHWGCRQSNGAERLIRDTVAEYGIPFLNLDGDLVDSRNYSEGQYRTRLEGFMEIMEG